MAHSIKCTNCGAILKTANPIAPGKKIKCPKCLKPFVVMAEDEEEDIGAEDAGAENEIPKSKKPAKVMDDEESAGDDEDEMPKMKGKGGDKAKRKGKDDENGAKPKKKSSSLLLIIIGVVLLFCCIGCTTVGWIFQATLKGLVGLGDAISKKIEEDKNKLKDKGDGDKGKEKDKGSSLVLNPADFAKEWKANRQESNRKYRGKFVEVTGAVQGFTIDLERKPVVLIPCGPEKDALLINISTKAKEPWALIGPGQTVTIRGKFKDFDFVPYFEDADFVDLKENKTLVLQATDLAAEAAADPIATTQKYKGKSLIVVGEVAKLDRRDEVILLKGKGAQPIECDTVAVERPALGKLVTVGKEARVFGTVTDLPDPIFNDNKSLLKLRDCLPITGAK